MYKWIDSNVQWMNIFTSIFSWFHIILNVNFEFKSSISFLNEKNDNFPRKCKNAQIMLTAFAWLKCSKKKC